MLDAEGATRVWVPVPLSRDTEYFKDLGTTWRAEGGNVTYSQDSKYATPIVSAVFPANVQTPVLVVTSRFATRDRATDLSSQPATRPSESPAELKLALQATEMIPIDGIVRETALNATKGQRTEVETGWKVPYFMYPDGQTGRGRLDPLDPDKFQYTITAKELKTPA